MKTFGQKLSQGGNNNVPQYYGDIRTHDGTDPVRLGIGNPGDPLKVDANDNLIWEAQEQTDKVYFVSPDGIDSTDTGRGLSQTAPFKTIKYATQYILADEGTRAS